MSDAPKFFCQEGQKLDPERIIYKDPKVDTYNINGKTFDVTRSAAFYIDDSGRECEILLAGPREYSYGVSPDYDDKKPENATSEEALKYLTGYQTCYLMTDKDRVDSPSKEEKAFKHNIDSIVTAGFNKGLEECDKDDTILPTTVTGAFESARKKKNVNLAIRPVYNHAKNKETKIIDKSTPLRMYCKLMTKDKGAKLRVETPYYLPGDVRKNPVGYIGKRGFLTPIYRVKGLTWGGKKFAAGLDMALYEANYEPQSSTQHTQRFISRNTANPVEEDEDECHEGDEFAPPSGRNPVDELNDVGGSGSSAEDEEPEPEPPKPSKEIIAAKKAAADKKRATLLAKKKAAK